MMTEIEVRREIYHLIISECRKGYTFAGPRIVDDEDADELSSHLFYRMKAKDLLKMEKVSSAARNSAVEAREPRARVPGGASPQARPLCYSSPPRIASLGPADPPASRPHAHRVCGPRDRRI